MIELEKYLFIGGDLDGQYKHVSNSIHNSGPCKEYHDAKTVWIDLYKRLCIKSRIVFVHSSIDDNNINIEMVDEYDDRAWELLVEDIFNYFSNGEIGLSLDQLNKINEIIKS